MGLFSLDAVAEQEQNLALSISLTAINESMSIRSLSGEWDREVDSGDRAIGLSRMSIGVSKDGFHLSYLQRHDVYYRYANETLQFIYQTENELSLENGTEYELKIEADKSSSHGLRAGYTWQLNDSLSVTPYISILSPGELLVGDLVGAASVISESDYDLVLNTELDYDEDPLYGRGKEVLKGDGYAVDVMFDYRMSSTWKVSAKIYDLLSELRIDNAPYTIAEATSAIKTYDENGYVQFNPVASGFDGYRDVDIEFEPQLHLQAEFSRSPDLGIHFGYHDLPGYDYLQLDLVQKNIKNQHSLSWHWVPKFSAAGVSYQARHWHLGLIADSFSYPRMKMIQLEAGLRFHF